MRSHFASSIVAPPIVAPSIDGSLRAARPRLAAVAAALLIVAGAAGCTVENPEVDAGRLDVPALDARTDAGTVSCTTAADCDDGVACTFDDCIVGNVCDHMALDSLCEDGERCDATRGCNTGCTSAADCNVDRNFCEGSFACAGGTCVSSLPRSCDDGNACTVDSCDEAAMGGLGGCVYATAGGCDAGMGGSDAGGPVCDPFDSATGFAGTFRLVPPQGLGCSAASYTLNNVTFSVSGGMLRVSGAPDFRVTMTGAVPSSADFTVSGTDEYGTYTLAGTFVCAQRFTGTYTYRPSGAWSVCTGSSAPVTGRP